MNIIDGNVEYDQVRHLNINLSHMILISPLKGVRFDVVFRHMLIYNIY